MVCVRTKDEVGWIAVGHRAGGPKSPSMAMHTPGLGPRRSLGPLRSLGLRRSLALPHVSSISLLAARDALVQNASGHRTAFLRRSDRFGTGLATDRFRTGLFLGENSDYSSVGQSYVRRYQASDSPSKRRTVLPTLPSVGQTSEHRTFERCYGSLHTLLGAARVRYRPCQRRC